nr:transcription repressor NadR [bacterium]
MTSDQRRQAILRAVRAAESPITATQLAANFGVSRQVIVQDIALLRAQGQDIIATPRGYMVPRAPLIGKVRRVITCCHGPERTGEELDILTRNRVSVIDVIIEHPLYGEYRAMLLLRTPADAQDFTRRLGDAEPLSTLTGGVHLHTLESATRQDMDSAIRALREAGILSEG